jgi:putative acetyltransferase
MPTTQPAAQSTAPADADKSIRLKIRDARDDDAAGMIALIEACYAEYEGCILDVDGEAPELKGIATAHAEQGGRFWVAESDGEIIGSVGLVPNGGGVWEMKKLYVTKAARRLGIGRRLVSLAEVEAMSRGAHAIELWSDTRFEDAHRLYERRGYSRLPETRELHDKSNTMEYHFRKALTG